MPTYPSRKPGVPGEPITLTIDGQTARRIRELHSTVNLGTEGEHQTSVKKYCLEIIEAFLSDRRSGRVSRERQQYRNRPNDDYTWEA